MTRRLRSPRPRIRSTTREVTAKLSPSLPTADLERHKALTSIHPHGAALLDPAVRGAVVEAVQVTPFTSFQVDRVRASILYRYARWLSTNGQTFDASIYLQDDRLRHYWASGLADLAPRSRDKHLSTLRTIADGTPFSDGALMRRYPLAPPYSDQDWDKYTAAAHMLPIPWSAHATMLLDLSGRLGLRGAEINRALTTDIETHSWGDCLSVVDTGHQQRHIPLLPDVTASLRSQPDGHLLRPQYRNRRNTVSSLVARLAHHDGTFNGFTVVRARHRWLLRLMSAPIPTADVIALAGLHGGNHALQDLAVHLPPTHWAAVAHHVRTG